MRVVVLAILAVAGLLSPALLASAVEFPLKNDGFVSELKGSKAPAALQLSPAAVGATAYITFTYAGDDAFFYDLSSNANVVGPQSLTLRWQNADNTTFTTLLTLITSFDEPNGNVTFAAIQAAVNGTGGTLDIAFFNQTSALWVVLTTSNGALAGRFTDVLEDAEDVASNEVFFLADIFGSPEFSFNTTEPTVWFPAANGTSTEFTLDITDNQDGTYSYNIYVTDDLAAAAVAVKLHFRNGSANYPVVLTLPANFTDANSGGYADVFTAQALRAGLLAAGQSLTTELFPAIHLPGGSIIAGRFDPVWTFDPTPPSPPPSPPSPRPPPPSPRPRPPPPSLRPRPPPPSPKPRPPPPSPKPRPPPSPKKKPPPSPVKKKPPPSPVKKKPPPPSPRKKAPPPPKKKATGRKMF